MFTIPVIFSRANYATKSNIIKRVSLNHITKLQGIDVKSIFFIGKRLKKVLNTLYMYLQYLS